MLIRESYTIDNLDPLTSPFLSQFEDLFYFFPKRI